MVITKYVILNFVFKREGRRWTAFCKELGTSTFGNTAQDAIKKIHEAATLHLNTLEKIGERERFFKEHKIKVFESKPTAKKAPPIPESFKKDYLIQRQIQSVRVRV
jgi:predicted RNase H-like HicB family nuclease